MRARRQVDRRHAPSTPSRREAAIAAAADWLIGEALQTFEPESGLGRLCERLTDAGVPLLRAHVSMRALHPLFRSVDLTWWRGRPIETARRPYGADTEDEWRASPLAWMLDHGQSSLRCRLDDPGERERFPILADLHAAGGTDYVARVVPFDEPALAREREDGLVLSWVGDAPGGFTDRDLDDLARIERPLALVSKLVKRERTAQNICDAYLGAEVGQRVLHGRIRLGDHDEIPAVVWYCDLRDSTALADRLAPREFLDGLNAFFECMAGAVLDHGGEVLRFIGDAVLAVFPIAPGAEPGPVARRALDAARDAGRRVARANAEREGVGRAPLGYGLALHVGSVLYGNIGVPTRVEFSVIGRAANEVCRIEGLTKHLGHPVLVSRAFADALPGPWIEAGRHALAGVSGELAVYAPGDG